jgi:predicted Zn-dependent protease
MAMMNKEEAQALLKKVLAFSKAEECEVSLSSNNGGNIRYARNTVSTSGEESNTTLAVTSAFGKRSGSATINEFDEASLEKVVRRSEELARLAPENPEYMPMLTPQQYLDVKAAYHETTAKIDPAYRAEAAAKSLEQSKKNKLVAAGFEEDGNGFTARLNSKGNFGYYRSTNVNFSVTVRTEDGTGSGYAQRDYNNAALLDAGKATAIAAEKAMRSVDAKAIEPGKYTVILEPAASVDLLRNMIFNMDQRTADEGRSFLAKKGGGTKLGEKIFDERVTIMSDPMMEEAPGAPWSGDGRPTGKTVWVENGVVKNLFCSRYWAENKKYDKALPNPTNGIMLGGNESLESLIKSTQRGILVTRLWYIRAVDPQTLLYTGLTRDGTFFIENGEIKYPVKNFRFNESPVIMLNNLEAMGKPERISGLLIPPMKIRDFTFTSLSDAV